MKPFYATGKIQFTLLAGFFAILAFFPSATGWAQSCPTVKQTTISTYPNTYYPGTQASVTAGSTTISLGASVYGTSPIAVGDALLIIQMQGAQIDSSNNGNYGSSGAWGTGYLNNGGLMAGKMEYVIAKNSVPLTGGSLTLQTGTVNAYKNSAFGSYGQYTYQIVRVPFYNDLKLTANISAPVWNGTTGGILVLVANDSIIFNGYTVSADAAGFRGGGGLLLSGNNTGVKTDFRTNTSVVNANGSKGEGLAGTPRYVNVGGVATQTGVEGYPGGAMGMGAPGNAGGGGTDGDPHSNDQNTGGGGGGNGGAGGVGGNAWSSQNSSGGRSASVFAQAAPNRLVMGGGGGAGTSNNGTGTSAGYAGSASGGASGGGIVILTASYFSAGAVSANGDNANSTVGNDGAGGGGAGGSILIINSAGGSLSNIKASAQGGTGGSNEVGGGDKHGPGGGGGGGIIYSNATLNAASSVTAGIAGLTSANTTNYGAGAGAVGISTQNISFSQTNTFPISCWILANKFVAVSAAVNDDAIAVTWNIQNASGVKEYHVEKSFDGSVFNTAGVVSNDPNNPSNTIFSYQDIALPAPGTVVYYRVVAVNQTGDLIYSATVTVKIYGATASGKLTIAPNPVQASPSTISFTSPEASQVTLRLVSINGIVVWQKNIQASAGPNYVLLDNTASLANGIYILQSNNGVKTENIKVLVSH